MRRHLTDVRVLGIGRGLALYYLTVILGYALVVLMLGHSLTEGLNLLRTQPGLAALLLMLPLPVVVGNVLKLWTMRRSETDGQNLRTKEGP